MAASAETDEAVASPTEVNTSHRLQAAAFWRRWKSRPRSDPAMAAKAKVPEEIPLPEAAWRHYRHFSWVIYEQRLFLLALGSLLASGIGVWTMALHLKDKQPVVVRAAPSLKQAAAAFYGDREVSYDQLAFFLNGCLPLLYATDDGGHSLLPLAQGLVAPEIYDEAEKRLNAARPEVLSHAMTQGLTLTEVTGVVADSASGRAAAYLRGYVTVTVDRAAARFFPWRARVLVEANPVSRLNPYPFYLVRCEQRTGPQALAWDDSAADAASKR
jgi:hypothetical protein